MNKQRLVKLAGTALLAGTFLAGSAFLPDAAASSQGKRGKRQQQEQSRDYRKDTRKKAKVGHQKKAREQHHRVQTRAHKNVKRQRIVPSHGYQNYGHRNRSKVIHRNHRPWYAGTRILRHHRQPYYYHAGFQVYFGGIVLNVELGDHPPAGYVYYDPYCSARFTSLVSYREHRHHRHHPPALNVVAVETCYDDGYGGGSYYYHDDDY